MILNPSGARVLLTGGAGFVGSRLARRILSEDVASLTILDDLFSGQRDAVPDERRVRFVEGSVTDIDLVDRELAAADLVFHLAARNIIVSTKNPREDYETNIGGTLNVLMAARKSEVKRVVYTSSASIYGNARHLPINEDDPLNLLSPYAVSKLAGENYCSAFYETHQLPVSVVRYSNVYGPGQSAKNPYCGVVSKFIECILEGKPLVVHGDGQQTRDFTFIDDAIEATWMAGLSSKAEGEVFNVGSGVETAVNDLAWLLLEIYDRKDLGVETIDRRDIDNIRRRVVNIEKIRRRLRWIPTTTLRRGLERTRDWFRDHDQEAR